MRLGIVLDPQAPDLAVVEARLAESLGLDFCWIPASFAGAGSGAVVAAAIAASTESIRLVLACPSGGHPMETAEELIVIDLIANGRLAAAIEGEDPTELLEVLEAVFAGRPFSHRGDRWTFPRQGVQGEILVTPRSPQFDFPIWLVGPEHGELAFQHAVSFVGRSNDSARAMSDRWEELGRSNAHQSTRLKHVAIRRPQYMMEGSIDIGRTVSLLHDERSRWGIDTCAIELAGPPEGDRHLALEAIGHRLRPQLQAVRLVPELVQSWDRIDFKEGSE